MERAPDGEEPTAIIDLDRLLWVRSRRANSTAAHRRPQSEPASAWRRNNPALKIPLLHGGF